MASSTSFTFLHKEIFENRNIVTYKLLSRKLAIHVNTAKNELASFHTHKRDSAEPTHATFLISGTISIGSANGTSDDMDVDGIDAPSFPHQKVLLIEEQELEKAKAEFTHVRSCHVYALSASPLLDVDAVCNASQTVRELDLSSDVKFLASVGKVVGDNFKPINPSGKTQTTAKPLASSSKPPPAIKPKEEEKSKSKVPAPVHNEKPKATGKLDWSKAKPKEVKKQPVQEKVESKPSEVLKTADASAKASTPLNQRGTKRKSDALIRKKEEDDAEDDQQINKEETPMQAETKTGVASSSATRVKGRVVVSDDEDEEVIVNPTATRKPKAEFADDDLDPERCVRAMMDIDDSEVIRVSRTVFSAQKEEEEEGEEEEESKIPQKKQTPQPRADGDVAMDEDSDSDPATKAKPRKRKEKKVIPIGKNGLKKKRVVKSRMKVDEKGYMVTEDYSSYESVDEEEAEAEAAKAKPRPKARTSTAKPKPKSNGKTPAASDTETLSASQGQTRTAAPVKAEGKKTSAKPTQSMLKRQPSGGGQKNLMSFFGGRGDKAKK